ncbi:hypothetical protein Ddye_003645 [Dipteronia dyeriana]|uniref:Pentatricopeptide repeat-containing protein n=1 Tax=Dipteronia dyeriana TaxID=168575 RepID=A0AAD9XSM6_9ROSI|nr:hypothetical protein Ddye_003645 [Dipteronia dyeriana]
MGCLCGYILVTYFLPVWPSRCYQKIIRRYAYWRQGSWTALISGYCQSWNAAEALAVLHEMRLEGVNMDPVTIASILPVCAQLYDTISGDADSFVCHKAWTEIRFGCFK